MHVVLVCFTILMAIGMGWSIGANDAANSLGTAVGSRVVTLRPAIILNTVFGFLGAVLQGGYVSIVGAIFGVGLVKGIHVINVRILREIVVCWLATPVFSGVIRFLLMVAWRQIVAIVHAGIEPAALLLCYHLAEALEAVTDRIDTASDYVKLVAVRAR